MKSSDTIKNKLVLKNEQEIRVLNLDKLLAVTVQDYLCTFASINANDFVCTKTLSEIEAQLPDNFIRISRNTIINTNKITSFNKKRRKIILENNLEYDISVRKLDGIFERLRV